MRTTRLGFRDLAITANSVTRFRGYGFRFAPPCHGPEYQRMAVVDDTPLARFLECPGQGRIQGQQNRVHAKLAERLLPAVLDVHQVEILVLEVVSVEVATPVDEDLVLRIEAVNEIVAPFIVSEDPGFRILA